MEHKYVEEALSYYNIPESEATLLRHNENMTFRIGADYLLQIHEHTKGFQTQHIYAGADRMAVYKTELQFLAYLKEQGMMIREPIKNRCGELITRLNNGTAVTVSRWVEGDSLDKFEITDEACYQSGVLTARLHQCAKGFQGFPVISYDAQMCEHIKERLRMLEVSGLNPAYSGIMQRACDAVGASLQKVQNEFQMLHGDLSCSNILVTKKGFTAIDFSLFGLGHPMLDMACLFGDSGMGGLACRQKIAEGYRAAGGVFNYEALDACFVLTILNSIMIHFEQWSKQDWYENRMKRWCKQSFEPFGMGERLFADDFYLIHVGG